MINTYWRGLLYFPLIIVGGIDCFGRLMPPYFAITGFAVALTLLFLVLGTHNISISMFTLLVIFVFGSMGFNVFEYFPINTGVDSWNNLAVAGSILRNGSYQLNNLPIVAYYTVPFMALSSSTFSIITALNIEYAFFLSPGILILIQPLLVFLCAEKIFANRDVAILSGFVVLLEPTLLQWLSAPIAESAALSFALMLLFFFLSKRTQRSSIMSLFLFAVISLTHAAMAIVTISLLVFVSLFLHRKRHNFVLLYTGVLVFLAYLLFSSTLNLIIQDVGLDFKILLGISQPSTGQSIYASSAGVVFLWWGLPAALAIMSLLLHRRDHVLFVWSFTALALLGLSFFVSLLEPSLGFERYAGLMAWALLAITAGRTLKYLQRSLLILVPIIFLVSFSVILTPILSPQYGLGSFAAQPSNQPDRSSMNWISSKILPYTTVYSNTRSWAYLNFLQFSDGVPSLNNFPYSNISSLAIHGVGDIVAVSSADLSISSCGASSIQTISQTSNEHFDIIYSNPCDFVELYLPLN